MTAKTCPKCGTQLDPALPEGQCPACLLKESLESEVSQADPRLAATDTGDVEAIPLALLKDLPNLDVLEVVGRGGMGVVYKARQRSLDRTVALKVLSSRVQNNPEFEERFMREAKALARLSHPSIVTLYDFGKANGHFYFVMEYVEGINLRQALQQGKFSPEAALQIVPKLCDALQYAHEQGVVHRDVKPENILIDQSGRVKIADFGLVKLTDVQGKGPALTATQEMMGTPHYMAPEQISRPGEVDHRADIYALGVVFYEMLTGELPIGRFAAPSKRVHVDVKLDDIVLRTLEHEPQRRYQSAGAVKTDIEAIPNGKGQNGKSGRSRDVRILVDLDLSLRKAWVLAALLIIVAGVLVYVIAHQHADDGGARSATAPLRGPAAIADLAPQRVDSGGSLGSVSAENANHTRTVNGKPEPVPVGQPISAQTAVAQPLQAAAPGTMQPAPVADRSLLQKVVTVHIDRSPDSNRLSVQYAVMAVCTAAGLSYDWKTSAEKADPKRRQFTDALHISNVTAEQALARVLGPVNLRYDVGQNGLYLYDPEQPPRPSGAVTSLPHPAVADRSVLQKVITAHAEKSPDGDRLTVQYAVIAVCEAAGLQYDWNASAEKADPKRREYVQPLHVSNVTAEQALAQILGPVNLQYDVGRKGLYLYSPENAARTATPSSAALTTTAGR